MLSSSTHRKMASVFHQTSKLQQRYLAQAYPLLMLLMENKKVPEEAEFQLHQAHSWFKIVKGDHLLVAMKKRDSSSGPQLSIKVLVKLIHLALVIEELLLFWSSKNYNIRLNLNSTSWRKDNQINLSPHFSNRNKIKDYLMIDSSVLWILT